MSSPTVIFLYNHSQNNLPNTGGAAGNANWKVFDSVNNKLAFLGEETDDGDPNSSKSIFSIPESGSREAPRQFVNNYKESRWDRIWLAGSNANQGGGGNYRYAYGFFIDGTTSQAPALQVWDSTSHETYNLQVLGGGTPANSLIRAISTTVAAPGDLWAGTPMAGSGGANSILLAAAAIGAPQMVYFNLRLLVPYTVSPLSNEPVICLFLTYA